MTPLHELSIAEAGLRIRDGTLTSTALTQHALARIAALDPFVHAFILVTDQRALDDAARADRELQAGLDHGPMRHSLRAQDVFATADSRRRTRSRSSITSLKGLHRRVKLGPVAVSCLTNWPRMNLHWAVRVSTCHFRAAIPGICSFHGSPPAAARPSPPGFAQAALGTGTTARSVAPRAIAASSACRRMVSSPAEVSFRYRIRSITAGR